MVAPANAPVALEDFIQAVQSQLDTAQARMTLRAQNDSLPLTFAIRDISMDLKAHVEFESGEVRIRPAGPQDNDPTVLHLVFTAITKPMIEENAVQLAADDKNDVPLSALGDELDPDERRRLEGIGIRTVSKLSELQKQGLNQSVSRITRLSPQKLEDVLSRVSRPLVHEVDVPPSASDELRQRLRVRGMNLVRDGEPPKVTIGGRPVNVVRASENELILAPEHDQFAGQMSLAFDQRSPTELWFDKTQAAPMLLNPANGADVRQGVPS